MPHQQDREDAMLRDTDYTSHPHHYLHLTRIITHYLLFALYSVCLLFFEAHHNNDDIDPVGN